jgi:hypothetical protein
MKFLYPQFLWALLAIVIPIVIHLFNFRKFKKVYFSNLKMLKQVDLETNKRSKLKHLLILLVRVLAVACLVFAFAQPYFPKQNEELVAGQKSVSVYIDNSFSMNAQTNDGDLLYLAKEKASKIANGFKPTDEFHLLTNDFEGKHQRFVSKEEFLNFVDEVQISSATRLLSEVQTKQLDILQNSSSNSQIAFLLSDFQATTSDINNLTVDSNVVINAVQFKANVNSNIYIDSAWFESPIRQINKDEVVKVKVVNSSNENAQVRLELTINNNTKGFSNVLVEANSFAETNLTFKSREEGKKACKITISEYPNPDILYDDSYYFGYTLNKNTSVLAINESVEFNDTTKGNINQLFNKDQYFKLTNVPVGNVNYAELNKYNLIILNGVNSISSGLQNELIKYVSAGEYLVVFPGEKPDLKSYNELLLSLNIGRINNKDTVNTKVSVLNYNHPLYSAIFEETPKQIDLPKVFGYYPLSKNTGSRSENLMSLQNGKDFLSVFTREQGKVYFFTVPLSDAFSNLGRHSIFVPTMLRIAESSGFQKHISYTLNGEQITIKDENYNLEDIHIENDAGGNDFIPEAQKQRGDIALYVNDQVTESGNYSVYNKEDVIGAFGLNYSRKESDLITFEYDELASLLAYKNIGLTAIENKKDVISKSTYSASSKIWKWLVVFGLLFLAIEVLIIKLLK